MKIAFLCALVILFTWTNVFAQTNLDGALGKVQRGFVVPSDTLTRYLYYNPPVIYPILNFTLFPCYGSLNWYLNINSVPVPNVNNSCVLPWNPNVKKTWCAPTPYNGTVFNILAQGIQTYSGAPLASAKFDMAIFLTEDSFDLQVPSPGGSGKLTGSLLDNVKKGERQQLSLQWIGTGNPNDTYTVYQYDNGANPISDSSGFIQTSGCGILEFMTPVAGLDIKNDGNQLSTTVSDLDPEEEFLFAVLVQRSGGYLNSYKVLRVNDSPVNKFSVVTIAFCLLLSLFSKFM